MTREYTHCDGDKGKGSGHTDPLSIWTIWAMDNISDKPQVNLSLLRSNSFGKYIVTFIQSITFSCAWLPAFHCRSILCCLENICGEFYAWTTTIWRPLDCIPAPPPIMVINYSVVWCLYLQWQLQVLCDWIICAFLPSFPWAGKHHGRKIQKLFSSLFLPLLSRPHGVFCSSCWTYLKSNLKCLATFTYTRQLDIQ